MGRRNGWTVQARQNFGFATNRAICDFTVRVRACAVSRQADERGAAAVEFALVSVLLFTVMFGILQYGLYFNDSLNVRQGTREAARSGVVETFSFSGCTETSNAKNLVCATKGQIGALTGTPSVKVWAPDGWTVGKALRVCSTMRSNGAVGLLPMPNDGVIRSITQMTIEQEDSKTSWATETSGADPSGLSWSWC